MPRSTHCSSLVPATGCKSSGSRSENSRCATGWRFSKISLRRTSSPNRPDRKPPVTASSNDFNDSEQQFGAQERIVRTKPDIKQYQYDQTRLSFPSVPPFCANFNGLFEWSKKAVTPRPNQ